MTDSDIISIFGKSIWDMTTTEIIEFDLVDVWVKLIEEGEGGLI